MFILIKSEEMSNGEDDDLPEDDRRKNGESLSVTGSLGSEFGGDNVLLKSQFKLHTAQDKRHMIVLLQVRLIQDFVTL